MTSFRPNFDVLHTLPITIWMVASLSAGCLPRCVATLARCGCDVCSRSVSQVVFDLEWRAAGSSTAAAEGDSAADQDAVMLPADAPIRAHILNTPIAARALASDGVIAVPTDTLYGACDYLPGAAPWVCIKQSLR